MSSLFVHKRITAGLLSAVIGMKQEVRLLGKWNDATRGIPEIFVHLSLWAYHKEVIYGYSATLHNNNNNNNNNNNIY